MLLLGLVIGHFGFGLAVHPWVWIGVTLLTIRVVIAEVRGEL